MLHSVVLASRSFSRSCFSFKLVDFFGSKQMDICMVLSVDMKFLLVTTIHVVFSGYRNFMWFMWNLWYSLMCIKRIICHLSMPSSKTASDSLISFSATIFGYCPIRTERTMTVQYKLNFYPSHIAPVLSTIYFWLALTSKFKCLLLNMLYLNWLTLIKVH